MDQQVPIPEELDDEPISDSLNDQIQLQQDLEAAIAKAEENLTGWKRTAADFENYRKRTESEKKELIEFAKEVTVAKLLPTLDTLEQALKHIPQYTTPSRSESGHPSYEEGNTAAAETLPPPLSAVASAKVDRGSTPIVSGGGGNDFGKQYQNWQSGIQGLVMQLDKVLEEMGVKKIESVGKKFDPNVHEAVREEDSEAEEGTIVGELQSGFELNGKVIRPSQVIISKKKL